MEIALVETVVKGAHTALDIGLHGQSAMDDQCPAWLDEGGVVTETLEIGLGSAIDVKMVGVGRSDDAHPGAQPMERAVELVGLNHYVVALLAQDVVGAIILRDASQEGIAVLMALMHDVGAHGRCGGLAVCTCKAEAFVSTGEGTQYLCAFLYLKAVFAEPHHLLVLTGYGRGIYDQCGGRFLTGMGYHIDVFLVVNQHAFFLQLARQFRRGLVVAGHDHSLAHEVAGKGTHADAASPHEIYCFNIL